MNYKNRKFDINTLRFILRYDKFGGYDEKLLESLR